MGSATELDGPIVNIDEAFPAKIGVYLLRHPCVLAIWAVCATDAEVWGTKPTGGLRIRTKEGIISCPNS